MTSPTPSPQLTEAFRAALPDALRSYCTGDPLKILRIPAKAPEVGDLVVRNDGDELTVVVGRIAHSHFEVYCASGSTEQERQREAAQGVVDWIQDIIAERVRFRVEFEGGRVIAGSSWYVEHHDGGRWLSRTDEVREYTWSGEKFHGSGGMAMTTGRAWLNVACSAAGSPGAVPPNSERGAPWTTPTSSEKSLRAGPS